MKMTTKTVFELEGKKYDITQTISELTTVCDSITSKTTTEEITEKIDYCNTRIKLINSACCDNRIAELINLVTPDGDKKASHLDYIRNPYYTGYGIKKYDGE